MSDLFFNKLAGAALAAALGFIGINKIAAAMVNPQEPQIREFAYLPEINLDEGKVEEIIIPFPSADWIAGRDETRGAKVFGVCLSCHNADNGGANLTGPNLWDIVGRTAATKDGFAYSSAMKNAGITWGYEELDAYLAKPADYIPKNNMAFIGIKKESDRAAVIEFLRLKADAPMEALLEAAPLPSVEEAMMEVPSETMSEAMGETQSEAMGETIIETVIETIEDTAHEGGH